MKPQIYMIRATGIFQASCECKAITASGIRPALQTPSCDRLLFNVEFQKRVLNKCGCILKYIQRSIILFPDSR